MNRKLFLTELFCYLSAICKLPKPEISSKIFCLEHVFSSDGEVWNRDTLEQCIFPSAFFGDKVGEELQSNPSWKLELSLSNGIATCSMLRHSTLLCLSLLFIPSEARHFEPSKTCFPTQALMWCAICCFVWLLWHKLRFPSNYLSLYLW